MPRTRPLLSSLAPLFFALTFTLSARAAQVTVSGRRLLVDGTSFTIKGVVYSPTRAGSRVALSGGYDLFTDTQTWQNDFKLLKNMGVNTVRILNAVNATQGFLDAARDNGLHVVMGYYVNQSWDVTNGSTQAAVQTQFLAMVNAWKSHPAVLMWSLGNEVTINNVTAPANPAAWYALLNSVAGAAKAADPDHPVTTSVADVGDIGKSANGTLGAAPSNLDLWGVNIYRGAGFTNAFTFLASTTTKPIWFSEFGADAYNGVAGMEAEDIQAAYLQAQWGEIAANLSAGGGGVLAGGTVFEWSDEWWKGAAVGGCPNVNLGSGGPLGDFVQDVTCDWPAGGYVDPNMNEEWWGIVAITTTTAAPAKRLREAYYVLRSLWNPSLVTSVGPVFFGPVTNAPNPVAPGALTTIFIPVDGTAERLSVDVLDGTYRRIATLPWTSALDSQGNPIYTATWNARNDGGNPAAPGVYVVRVDAAARGREDVTFRKIVVVP